MAGSAIWRDDEGRMDAPSPVSSPETSELWRDDEGASVRVLPNEPLPRERRSQERDGRVRRPKRKLGRRRRAPIAARGRHISRVLWIAAAVLIVALAVDGTTAMLALRSSLEASSEHLAAGREAMTSGRLEEATKSFEDARDDASRADGLLSRPTFSLASNIPLLDRDVESLRRLTTAVETVATTGRTGIDLAEDLGVSEDGIAASLYEDGVVQLEKVEEAQEPIGEIAASLDRVSTRLLEAPVPSVGPIRDALRRARTQVLEASESAQDADALFAALPDLLGGNGQTKYLLAFQATGEARATGGVIGLYGILSANEGELELGRIGPYANVVPEPLADPVDAPGWFETSYGPQFALRQWQQVNSSPNFPVVAEVLLQMFERGTGQRLDGVIAMDPLALKDMMEGTGHLQIPGEEVTSDEVVDVLLRDSYERFQNPREQDLYLAALVNSFWDQIESGDFDAAEFASGIGRAAATRHLMAYSRTQDSQGALNEIDASGAYADAGDKNVQMVFHNNYSVNKVDYFLHRSTSTEVKLTRDGQANVTTEVVMRNLAPDGPKSLLLGRGRQGTPPGLNRMLFNLLVPRRAEIETIWVDGDEVPIAEFRDDEYRVAWDVLEIPPGDEITVTASYRVLDAISVEDGIPRLRFRFVGQPLVNPEEFSVTFQAPTGLALAKDSPDTEGVKEFRTKGVLDEPRTFDFVIVESED